MALLPGQSNLITVSSDAAGVLGNASSSPYGVSADGRYVVFESDASNLVAGDTNGFTDLFLKDIQTGAIIRVNTDALGNEATGGTLGGASMGSDISADGRYVVFGSAASNLVANDTNGVSDVFIKDTQTGAISRVNTNALGNEAMGGTLGSGNYDISADGRYVVFESDARNLVANDTNGMLDIFLKDTQTGTITRVSAATGGTQAVLGVSNNMLRGFVSDDGRYVVFESNASNLVAGDTNGVIDIFKKDLQTGAITRVNTDMNGAEAIGGVDDFETLSLANDIAGISADGRYVAFNSLASNLVAGDANGVRDVFIKDTLTGAISRVNTDAVGTEANAAGNASFRALSADGRYVSFHSAATNLVAGDTNGVQDSFVKDTLTGAIARVSLDAAGGEAVGGNSSNERISADGSTIVFRTSATNLATGHVAGIQDVLSVANPFMLVDTAAMTVTGGNGNDTLTGGSSNDVLTGGGGVDTFNVDAGTDTLTDAVPGTDIINISSGATAMQSLTVATASYAANTTNNGTLVVNALPTTASTITGSSGVDSITGSSADDSLDGGVGNDTLNGGAGNDVIEGGLGADTMEGGSGNDMADIFVRCENPSFISKLKKAGAKSVVVPEAVAADKLMDEISKA